jgi:hypothetical protein
VEEHIPQTTKEWSLWRSTYRKLQRSGLCGGTHTANYKGCEHYHNLTRSRNATQNPQVSNVKYSVASVSQPVTPPLNTQPIPPPRVTRTYADITRGGNDNNQDITLSKFLKEFKQMFHQLIQQNSLVINIITTLISKMK